MDGAQPVTAAALCALDLLDDGALQRGVTWDELEAVQLGEAPRGTAASRAPGVLTHSQALTTFAVPETVLACRCERQTT
jgi:hypothetical protein